MRLALISDLHANVVALEAVLRDARAEGVDQVVCLGDVATLGPQPTEILAQIRSLKGPCILGNHDEFLADPQAKVSPGARGCRALYGSSVTFTTDS